jgi:hypothetical protein
MKEYKLKEFENNVVRRISSQKSQELTRGYRKLNSETCSMQVADKKRKLRLRLGILKREGHFE